MVHDGEPAIRATVSVGRLVSCNSPHERFIRRHSANRCLGCSMVSHRSRRPAVTRWTPSALGFRPQPGLDMLPMFRALPAPLFRSRRGPAFGDDLIVGSQRPPPPSARGTSRGRRSLRAPVLTKPRFPFSRAASTQSIAPSHGRHTQSVSRPAGTTPNTNRLPKHLISDSHQTYDVCVCLSPCLPYGTPHLPTSCPHGTLAAGEARTIGRT
jgi:hypothetical protein